jgi:hypothetical protein
MQVYFCRYQRYINWMLKSLSAFVVSMALLFLAAPLALMGIIGISGNFVDMTTRDSLRDGLFYLCASAITWGTALVLSWWGTGHEVPTKFSLRTLMIGMTGVAIILGLIAAL